CFKYNTLEYIVEELKNHKENGKDSRVKEWAAETLKRMEILSVISMKVTLEALRRGRKQSFSECLQMEYLLAQNFLNHSDFSEGVTAKFDTKVKPVWRIPFDEMSKFDEKELTKKFFKPAIMDPFVEIQRKSTFLERTQTFYDYPHRPLSSLPTELDIHRVLLGRAHRSNYQVNLKSKKEVLEWFLLNWGGYDAAMIGASQRRISIAGGFGRGKTGLKEKIETILEQRCVEEGGRLKWVGP
ncbi:hypothetical protein HK096_001440, partial [Nowakowskiella sp. JEL0078]